MSIKLGNNKIIDIYKDNEEIVKIYNGNQKIYDLYGDVDYNNLANNNWKLIKHVIHTEGVPENWKGQIKTAYYNNDMPNISFRLIDWTPNRYDTNTDYGYTNAVFEAVELSTEYVAFGPGGLQDRYSTQLGNIVNDMNFYDINTGSIINNVSATIYYYNSSTHQYVSSKSYKTFLPCCNELGVNGDTNTKEDNVKGCFSYYLINSDHSKYIYGTSDLGNYWTRTIEYGIKNYAYFIYQSETRARTADTRNTASHIRLAPCFAL